MAKPHRERPVDRQFEADTLAAFKEYELTGEHVSTGEIEKLFEDTYRKATLVAEKICHGKPVLGGGADGKFKP